VDNTQNIISFCSGYGGLDRGLELAGVKTRVVAYVEIEAFAIANLVAKMETGLLVPAPVWTNLKTFPLEAFRGRVHGITAGYPCQPFSVAGQRKGTDDPRHLWPYIRQAVNLLEPRWCFFENVEGHVTLGLSTVIGDLEEDGYRAKAGLFTAAEVGAPHRRKRVFILGDSEHDGLHGSAVARSITATVPDNTQREDATREPSGANNARELADRNCSRLPIGACEQFRSVSKEEGQHKGREFGRNPSALWPSRPGQEQYVWEEPRVVESKMGGAVDGFTSRVDELRLLGNGVVPQQAAKAYLTLKGES
jgi:DNA (cytosine-5)-methyltransferase 1